MFKLIYFSTFLFSISSFAFSLNVPIEFLSGNEVMVQEGKAERYKLPSSFDVLVWNTYKGRKEGFSEKLNSYLEKAELVLLQEFTPDVRNDRYTGNDEGYEYSYASTFVFKGKKKSGVATGSRARAKTQHFVMSDGGYGVVMPKATLITTYRIEGRSETLLVANIHAKNLAIQAVYEDQINGVLAVISNHKGPVLFAGDFNSWSVERFNFLRNKLSSLGMNDLKFGIDKDIRMKAPIFMSFFDDYNFPLDQVFYRGLKLQNATVSPTDEGSDHGAITFKLVVNKSYEQQLNEKSKEDLSKIKRIVADLKGQLLERKKYTSFCIYTGLLPRYQDLIYKDINATSLSFDNSSYLITNSFLFEELKQTGIPLKELLCLWDVELNNATLKEIIIRKLYQAKLIDEEVFNFYL